MAHESLNQTPESEITGANLNFSPGAQPDIIRANQKDVYYQSVLQEQFSQACQQFLGSRWQHQWQTEINLLSDFCYHGLTTLMGSQTLGEEYCDLVQTSQYSSSYLSLMRRTCLVFIHTVLPYMYSRSVIELKRIAHTQQHPTEVNTRMVTAKWKRKLISFTKAILPNIQNFFSNGVKPAHLAIFYFYGAYYSFSKRVTGVRYIFTRQLGLHEQRSGYEVLGILISIQLIIQAHMTIRNHCVLNDTTQETDKKKTHATDSYSELLAESNVSFKNTFEQELENQNMRHEEKQMLKCALCLEPRKITTATPCGHLFCWSCVTEWCQNKPECPLCRSGFSISHLIPLNNK